MYQSIVYIHYEMLVKYLLIHTKSVVTVIEGARKTNNSKLQKKIKQSTDEKNADQF